MNTCVKCLSGLGIPTVGQPDLAPKNIVEDVTDDDYYDADTERQYTEDVTTLLYDDRLDE